MAEIFYTVSPELHRMARIEGGEVVELDFEIPGKPFSLLNGIFLGRVVEVQKPLQAAFVDIGMVKPGIVPLREGALSLLKQGDAVLVQVTRDENPLEDKGARLTRLISLSLGPLVYTPFRAGLSVSKRLKNREVFKKLISLKPEEGVILRNWAAIEDPFEDILLQLRGQWEAIQAQLGAKPPVLLSPLLDLLARTLCSLGSSDKLSIDDRHLALRTNERGTFTQEKAFDERCEEAWESLYSSEISLLQGGNITIEETHAMVVIDVNSQGALRHSTLFNKTAVQEILRQIRLRDLGGKMVVDLIHPSKSWKPLFQDLETPSNLQVWGISPMGLLEMTRQKKRLSVPQRLKHHLN